MREAASGPPLCFDRDTRPASGESGTREQDTGKGYGMASRAEVRAGIGIPQRVQLLENDADTFEGTLRSLSTRTTGVLVSTATSAVLLAINAAVLLSGK